MRNLFCVVDMQYPFVQAMDSCYLAQVVQELRLALMRGEHIVILEDRSGCPTDPAIMAELNSYPYVSFLRKSQWDGSLQIAIELSDSLLFVPDRITACGAFAEECVMATLAGLRDRFPGIELAVLRSACVPRPVGRFSLRDWQDCSRRFRLLLS